MDHNTVEQIWNDNAEQWIYASEKGYDIWRDKLNTPAFLNFLPEITNKQGLDIACGDGYNTRKIAERCQHLYAIDLSEKFIEYNKLNHPDEKVTYERINAANTNYHSEQFDFIVSTMAFMDIAEIDSVLKESHRILKSDGFLQFSIIHPCYNRQKGQWIRNDDGSVKGFLVNNYFLESEGEIQEWQHKAAPLNAPLFKVPRFTHPLSQWFQLIAEAGFYIEELLEPHASDDLIAKYPVLKTTQCVAHSLMFRVRKIQSITHPIDQILRKLPANVWWKDSNLKYLGVNDRVLEMLSLDTQEEIIGKTDFDIFSEEFARKLHDVDKYILNTGNPICLEETITLADGTPAVMLTNKSPSYDRDGNVNGIIGTSTNITDRKIVESQLAVEKERAQDANRAKSNFLAVVSHELRTPLNAILGSVNIMQKRMENASNQDSLSDIENSAKNLLKIVNDILDYTRLNEAKLSITESEFSLQKEVNNIVNQIKPLAEAKHIHFTFDLEQNIPERIIGDGLRIHQVISNLLSNAIKFTEQGSVSASISLLSQHANHITLRFSVADSGIGISAENHDKIFQRFMQVNSSYNRSYEGVGLGLSICKQLIELMGGKLNLNSQLGKGSEFWFDLSFSLPIHDNSSKQADVVCNHQQDNKKILVVEDNKLNQKVAYELLSSVGHQVIIVDNAIDAIEKLHHEQFDVVLMDVGLPMLDGIQATRNIRNDPTINNQVIIGLTAHALEEDKQKCIRAGMNDVVTKPININDMCTIIDKCTN